MGALCTSSVRLVLGMGGSIRGEPWRLLRHMAGAGAMSRYHGKARNDLARTLDSPPRKRIHVRPWALAAWAIVIAVAVLSCL